MEAMQITFFCDFREFINTCKTEIMTLTFLISSWYYYATIQTVNFAQIGGLESSLFIEAAKLGFAVLILTVAVVFLFLFWKKERAENKALNLTMVERTDVHNDKLTELYNGMIASLRANTDTMSKVSDSMGKRDLEIKEQQAAILQQLTENKYILKQIKEAIK